MTPLHIKYFGMAHCRVVNRLGSAQISVYGEKICEKGKYSVIQVSWKAAVVLLVNYSQ